jgi:hypothetical protein
MEDCTPELLCSIYGMNCDQVGSPPAASTPTVETPAETPVSNDAGASENTDSSQELVPVQGPTGPDQDINYDEC